MDSDLLVVESSDLGPKFEPLVISCIFKSKGFLEKYRPVILSDAFVVPVNRFVVEQILEYYDFYKKVPGLSIFCDILERSEYRKRDECISVVRSLSVVEDVDYVGDRMISWAKWRKINDVLSDDQYSNDPKGLALAVTHASRTGDEVKASYVSVDDDRPVISTGNEIIPTPWPWLNKQLSITPGLEGGPVKQDFAVILTVINGGKTTILTNIAKHSALMGKKVVFFTFEDGVTKIRRRLLQSICGITPEQYLDDPQGAKEFRNEMLEESGGKIFVQKLRTGNSSVLDAATAVRIIQDLEQTEIDVVITDYPDRFKPRVRRNEPRHELREIYEDCKDLAGDLNVLHWGASQVNKQKTGKDIVGIEDGSESTGKFESCDIAIGFGQTLQDERIKRITLHTSKMRDAAKHQRHSLSVHFDKQLIFEPGFEPESMQNRTVIKKKLTKTLKKKRRSTQ